MHENGAQRTTNYSIGLHLSRMKSTRNFLLCGSRIIHEFYCVSHKQEFSFQFGSCYKFRNDAHICGVPCCWIHSNPTEPHKTFCALFFGILLLLPPQLVFFSSSAVLFLVFYSRHMISLVAIVRLSLWCQNPKKIIVSFRRFGTIYIYIPFFHPQINSNGLFACEYVGRAMCDFDNDGTLARERDKGQTCVECHPTQLNWSIFLLFFSFINVLFSSSEPSLTLLPPQYIYGIINATHKR